MYSQILVLPSVLDTIRREVRLAPRTETGGALVGYLDCSGILIVTDACGPGPRAELKRMSVLIDGQYAHKFCTEVFNRSSGHLDYVGDWHRHLGWSLKASAQDLNAMLTIEESKCCSVPYPITAIYRCIPEHMVTYALADQMLKRVKMRWGDNLHQ